MCRDSGRGYSLHDSPSVTDSSGYLGCQSLLTKVKIVIEPNKVYKINQERMSDYEKLKQVIQQANPEIMELKFGCEFEVKENAPNHPGGEHFILHVSQRHPLWFEAKTDRTDGRYLDFRNQDIEILGRPIGLPDVLLASMASIDDRQSDSDIRKQLYPIEALKILAQWDLKKTLDHQNAETKKFLIQLLTKDQ